MKVRDGVPAKTKRTYINTYIGREAAAQESRNTKEIKTGGATDKKAIDGVVNRM